MKYSVGFTDTDGWLVCVEVVGGNTWDAVRGAMMFVRDTERGKKLGELTKIEVEEVED